MAIQAAAAALTSGGCTEMIGDNRAAMACPIACLLDQEPGQFGDRPSALLRKVSMAVGLESPPRRRFSDHSNVSDRPGNCL